ncbi:hypothetical protein [uncultured Shimia sp.]|uniref:hypothetical protein n=1 Tax=uncultured Shimia sp. TaxID=573152 RepID=UPI002634B882|nr:hypothetical protein [uncultured Shimia sp.]
MPIESHLLTPAPLVYSRFTGCVTFKEFTDSSQALHANPDFYPGMHMVLDMLNLVDFDVGFDDMKAFTARVQERHRERGEPVHIFIVCSNEQSTWLAEMFRSLSDLEDGMASVDILQGFPDVLAILDLPPETIELFPEDCQSEAHLLTRMSS